MKRIIVLSVFVLLFIGIAFPLYGVYSSTYNPDGPLIVKKAQFCAVRPRGIGRIEALEKNVFKEDRREVYLYIEVSNCKPVKKEEYYHAEFSIDVDIYYEDGICVYSKREANNFDCPRDPGGKEGSSAGSSGVELCLCHSGRGRSSGYMWLKLDISDLRPGDYKIESTVRDINSKKKAFVLERFTILPKG